MEMENQDSENTLSSLKVCRTEILGEFPAVKESNLTEDAHMDVPDFVSDIKQEIIDEEITDSFDITKIKKEEIVPFEELSCSYRLESISADVKNQLVKTEDNLDEFNKPEEYADGKQMQSENMALAGPGFIKCEPVDIKDEEESLSPCDLGAKTQRNKMADNSAVKNSKNHYYKYKCYECDFKTRRKFDFAKHIGCHNKEKKVLKIHKCLECDYQSNYIGVLKRHTIGHKSADEVTMYKCPQCDYQTPFKDVLTKKHSVVHKSIHEVAAYKCNECDYQSKYKSALNRHMKRHNNVNELKVHKCLECSYESYFHNNLYRHSLRHKNVCLLTKAILFRCSKCDFQAINKYSVRQHLMKIHEIDKIKSLEFVKRVNNAKCIRKNTLFCY